jgi:hypothetical protein
VLGQELEAERELRERAEVSARGSAVSVGGELTAAEPRRRLQHEQNRAKELERTIAGSGAAFGFERAEINGKKEVLVERNQSLVLEVESLHKMRLDQLRASSDVEVMESRKGEGKKGEGRMCRLMS